MPRTELPFSFQIDPSADPGDFDAVLASFLLDQVSQGSTSDDDRGPAGAKGGTE